MSAEEVVKYNHGFFSYSNVKTKLERIHVSEDCFIDSYKLGLYKEVPCYFHFPDNKLGYLFKIHRQNRPLDKWSSNAYLITELFRNINTFFNNMEMMSPFTPERVSPYGELPEADEENFFASLQDDDDYYFYYNPKEDIYILDSHGNASGISHFEKSNQGAFKLGCLEDGFRYISCYEALEVPEEVKIKAKSSQFHGCFLESDRGIKTKGLHVGLDGLYFLDPGEKWSANRHEDKDLKHILTLVDNDKKQFFTHRRTKNAKDEVDKYQDVLETPALYRYEQLLEIFKKDKDDRLLPANYLDLLIKKQKIQAFIETNDDEFYEDVLQRIYLAQPETSSKRIKGLRQLSYEDVKKIIERKEATKRRNSTYYDLLPTEYEMRMYLRPRLNKYISKNDLVFLADDVKEYLDAPKPDELESEYEVQSEQPVNENSSLDSSANKSDTKKTSLDIIEEAKNKLIELLLDNGRETKKTIFEFIKDNYNDLGHYEVEEKYHPLYTLKLTHKDWVSSNNPGSIHYNFNVLGLEREFEKKNLIGINTLVPQLKR